MLLTQQNLSQQCKKSFLNEIEDNYMNTICDRGTIWITAWRPYATETASPVFEEECIEIEDESKLWMKTKISPQATTSRGLRVSIEK